MPGPHARARMTAHAAAAASRRRCVLDDIYAFDMLLDEVVHPPLWRVLELDSRLSDSRKERKEKGRTGSLCEDIVVGTGSPGRSSMIVATYVSMTFVLHSA